MYNQIFSIVNDFIKAVEQDKNFSIFLRNWKESVDQKEDFKLHRLYHYMSNYENFLKASNKSIPIISLFTQLSII